MSGIYKNVRRDDDLVAAKRDPITSFSTEAPGISIDLPTATASVNKAQPSVGTLIIGSLTTTVRLPILAPTSTPEVGNFVPTVNEADLSSPNGLAGATASAPTGSAESDGAAHIRIVPRADDAFSASDSGSTADVSSDGAPHILIVPREHEASPPGTVTFKPTVPTAAAAASLAATTLAERFISIGGSGSGDDDLDGSETFNHWDSLTPTQKIVAIVCTTVIGTILIVLIALCVYTCRRRRRSRKEKHHLEEAAAFATAHQHQQQQPYQYGAGYAAAPAAVEEARWKDGTQAPGSTYTHTSAGQNPFNDNYSTPPRY